MNNGKIKIGVDLDDVVVDFVPSFLDFYNFKYGKNILFGDVTSFNLWEVGIGRNREEAIKLVHEFYDSCLYEEMPLIKGSKEGIDKLKSENEVCFVTARYLEFREKTDRFARINFDDLRVFYSKDFYGKGKTKKEVCDNLGIKILIDDNNDNARECNENGVKVFLFDKPWNKGFDRKICRVYDWEGILNEIMEFKDSKDI